jgi:hypothetical protein
VLQQRFESDSKLDFPQFHLPGRHVINQKISSWGDEA